MLAQNAETNDKDIGNVDEEELIELSPEDSAVLISARNAAQKEDDIKATNHVNAQTESGS